VLKRPKGTHGLGERIGALEAFGGGSLDTSHGVLTLGPLLCGHTYLRA
jgi:hypothetical protein